MSTKPMISEEELAKAAKKAQDTGLIPDAVFQSVGGLQRAKNCLDDINRALEKHACKVELGVTKWADGDLAPTFRVAALPVDMTPPPPKAEDGDES